jgi:hypothetical protein
MKNLLLIIALFCCQIGYTQKTKSPTKTDIAKKKVKEYLNANLDDIASYMPAEWGPLEAFYEEFRLSAIGIGLYNSRNDLRERQLVFDRMIKGGGKDSAEYAPFSMKNKLVLDSVENIYNELSKKHVRKLMGYTIRHKFRARNIMGGYVLYEYEYLFDSELKFIYGRDLRD